MKKTGVRITSGKYKDKPLHSPGTLATHPMSARARLGLFNMLGSVEGLKVLDLYAGTGALGLEALSRGAASATFVEIQPQTAHLLKNNLRTAGVTEPFVVYTADAQRVVLKPEYDLIFVDPPYPAFNAKKVLKFKKYLKPGGRLVVSSPKEIELGEKTATYARCRITVL